MKVFILILCLATSGCLVRTIRPQKSECLDKDMQPCRPLYPSP